MALLTYALPIALNLFAWSFSSKLSNPSFCIPVVDKVSLLNKIACRIELISLLTITILIYNLHYVKRGKSFRLKANMTFPCVADFMVQIGNEQQNLHWWQSILSLLKIHITKVYQVDKGKNKYSLASTNLKSTNTSWLHFSKFYWHLMHAAFKSLITLR